jgi:DNA-directed RNA polymerase subunit RPC12/RpoP
MTEKNDWEYRCTNCAHVVLASADFNAPCPNCGGHGWISRWLNKPGSKVVHDNRKTGGSIPSSIVTTQNQMTPLNCTDGKGNKPILGQVQDGKRPGGNHRAVPDDMVKELASQGLGCKAIANKLLDQGIVISPSTINRRLQGGLL